MRNSAGQSSFMLLEGNKEALDWRLALCDHATRSIDIQYFIWRNDETGNLLFTRLLAAADRGVRVRLLVDDLALAAKDQNVAALCQHPNLDIRLFNPSAQRRLVGFGINMLVNFRELNRRMHNKLFVADGRMAIVGGRNVGNEYFGLNEKFNFRDMDVLVAGPVVPEISEAFDAYWNNEKAVPGQALTKRKARESVQEMQRAALSELQEQRDLLRAYPLSPQDWQQNFHTFRRNAHRGEAHFLQDEPKPIGDEELRLADMINYLAKPSHEELLIISPYLIPLPSFLDNLKELGADGVEVRILTSGLESTDNRFVNSHYKKYRKPLLQSGAELFELRRSPTAAERGLADVDPVMSSFVSLHAKVLVGDRQRCFIGSLNLDPRAVVINTENGLLIESPGLSSELATLIDRLTTPENSWSVTIDHKGRLLWKNSDDSSRTQPARNAGQRLWDAFVGVLPIESQL